MTKFFSPSGISGHEDTVEYSKVFLYSEEDIEGIPNIQNHTFKKPTTQNNQLKTQPTKNIAGTAIFLNSFIQNDGFCKLSEVLFHFIYFLVERQKILPFTKLTTIHKVKWITVALKNIFLNVILFSDWIKCVV